MGLIIKSFILSFGVFGRMIFPAIAITILSGMLWAVLNIATAGYAAFLQASVTSTFIALFGIRVALSLLGERHQTAYNMLLLYAFLYGALLLVAKEAAARISGIIAVISADVTFGEAVSLRSFGDAEASLQVLFAAHVIGFYAIISLVLYTVVHALMAVPLASAARAASKGTMSARFFAGFGRSFVPLFVIFGLAFFLQFFFGLIAALFAVISVAQILIANSVADLDLEAILLGLGGSAGLLWLNCWVWAASAVAFLHSDQAPKRHRKIVPAATPEIAMDIRALRKSRE